MEPISAITSQIAMPVLAPASAPASAPGAFQNMLSASIQTQESQQADAQTAAQKFLSGETDDIHKVALATQRADLSAELFMQVRNKVISAYQEVMKMQM
jgi:flagellar hook-basal body complex protein FliE